MKIDMKSAVIGFFISLVLCFIIFINFNTNCYVEPIFSPNSEARILDIINNAQKSIDVEMYVFSSNSLRQALIDANNGGVKVRVILEQEIESNEDCFYNLISNEIDVKWAPRKFSRTHSKFMIIDGKKVFVGSTNFSYSAITSNREAAVLTSCSVQNFISVFEQDWNEI
ncbi:DUF1669 domain-containing protein [Candidatus Micrarchaeota archaeon]|nr:DUF1669 domain-containing protein [Candidatus Micrarchaeota archaeon]